MNYIKNSVSSEWYEVFLLIKGLVITQDKYVYIIKSKYPLSKITIIYRLSFVFKHLSRKEKYPIQREISHSFLSVKKKYLYGHTFRVSHYEKPLD